MHREMLFIVAASLLYSHVASQAHIQVKQPGCTPPRIIFCGEEKHELNVYDCERWAFQYCTKTLYRKPPRDDCVNSTALDWDRSQQWRLLISETLLNLPCLYMDERSLTLICQQDCNDTLVDSGIEECGMKYSRGLIHYVERTPGMGSFAPSPHSCPSCPTQETDAVPYYKVTHLIGFIVVVVILALQLMFASKLNRLHSDIRQNKSLPDLEERNEYQQLRENTVLPVDGSTIIRQESPSTTFSTLSNDNSCS